MTFEWVQWRNIEKYLQTGLAFLIGGQGATRYQEGLQHVRAECQKEKRERVRILVHQGGLNL